MRFNCKTDNQRKIIDCFYTAIEFIYARKTKPPTGVEGSEGYTLASRRRLTYKCECSDHEVSLALNLLVIQNSPIR